MKSPRTLVVVAYYAPPAVGIASHRLQALVRHLRPLGWEPVVVAPEDVHYHREGSGEVEGARVVRVPNPEPSRWLRRIAGAGRGPGGDGGPDGGVDLLGPVDAGPVGGVLRRWAREWLYLPDARALWIPGAARAAERAVRDAAGPVVVYSTSVPYSAHFAAMGAAVRTGAPWVAEYRDPWSAAPPQTGRRSALRSLVDRRLDGSVVGRADRLVVTAEATRSLFLETFPELEASSVAVVRNGWEEKVADAAPRPERPLLLLYSGTLLRWEWAVPLLRALRDLAADRGAGVVRLRVLGPREAWVRAAGEVDGADGVLELPGMVPGAEMPGRLAAASALVALQPPPELGLYVAGKSYEYLGSRRPVLGWLPPGTEMTRLLGEHGDLRLVPRGEPGAFRAALERLLEEHAAGTLQGPRVGWEAVEPLSWATQAERLSRVLDGILAGRAGGPGAR